MLADHATRRRSLWAFLIDKREVISTLQMGLAAVVSTWCAYQSAIWGGIQTIRFNEAAASRVESTRSEVTSTQHAQIDIATFLAWVQALQAERGSRALPAGEAYQPDPATVSGFLFERFRADFKPAIRAWIATRPLLNSAAPPTPFAMEEYQRPLAERALALATQAEQKGAEARRANHSANRYMLMTVLAALTVFFSGLSTKLMLPANGLALLLMALALLVICGATLAALPVSVD